LGVIEEQDSENGSQAGREKLNIRRLWQTQQIQEVSPAKQSELVEETGLRGGIAICASVQFRAAWSNLIMIVH